MPGTPEAQNGGSSEPFRITDNSFLVEEAFNQGYPQELLHFINCVRNDTPPVTTGEDGRAVLEMLYAAYCSAGRGAKVTLPFRQKVTKPIDLWLGSPE